MMIKVEELTKVFRTDKAETQTLDKVLREEKPMFCHMEMAEV